MLITKWSHFELKNIVHVNQEIEFPNTLALLSWSPLFPTSGVLVLGQSKNVKQQTIKFEFQTWTLKCLKFCGP